MTFWITPKNIPEHDEPKSYLYMVKDEDLQLWAYTKSFDQGIWWTIDKGWFTPLKTLEDYENLEISSDRYRELLHLLSSTDYKVMKYLEGEIPEDEWQRIKSERHSWRAEANELQEKYGF